MPNKYNETISKIEASDELKQKIIERMKQENIKETNKGGVIVKTRKIITSIIAVLTILVGSGVVYAAMGGTIFGRPALELFGISFTEKYEEYVMPIENQGFANEKVKLDLVSTVSDSGFIVLNFNLKYTDEYIKDVKDRYIAKGWTDDELEHIDVMHPFGISFNDMKDEEGEWLYIHNSYDKVIIDGKEFTIRGRSMQDIQTIVRGQEYEIYVLYFLADYETEGKEEFTLTLKQPIIEYIDDKGVLDSKYTVFDGEFNINVSKEKAIRNSEIIEGNNTEIKIGDFSNKLEKVILTPMQTIIKLTTTKLNRTPTNSTSLIDENYIGDAEYLLYNNKNEKQVPFHEIIANRLYVHIDGTKVKAGPEEGMETPELLDGDEIVEITYIIFEKSEKASNVALNVYSNNEYEDIVKLMGTYNINLSSKKIETSIKNEVTNMACEQFSTMRWFGDTDKEVWNIPLDEEDSKENIILFQGEEIKPYIGMQKVDMMEVTPENIDKYSTNYYNYGKGKYYGKYKYIFSDDIAFTKPDGKEYAYINTYFGDFSFTNEFNPYPRAEKRSYYNKYNKDEIPTTFIELYSNYDLDVIEIDLDGNGTNEYIVCAQRGYDESISSELPYSVVALYDSKFNKVDNLIIEKNLDIEDFDESELKDLRGILGIYCIQCIDLDADGNMEILIDLWDIDCISIYKYHDGYIDGATNLIMEDLHNDVEENEELYNVEETITENDEEYRSVYMNENDIDTDVASAEILYDEASSFYWGYGYFEINPEYENVFLSKLGQTIQCREITNFDEITNAFFTQKGKKQFIETVEGVIVQDGKAYTDFAARGGDVNYVSTELSLKSSSENKMEYIAKSKYIDDEDYHDYSVSYTGNKFRFEENPFVLVLEDGRWKVDEFTLAY